MKTHRFTRVLLVLALSLFSLSLALRPQGPAAAACPASGTWPGPRGAAYLNEFYTGTTDASGNCTYYIASNTFGSITLTPDISGTVHLEAPVIVTATGTMTLPSNATLFFDPAINGAEVLIVDGTFDAQPTSFIKDQGWNGSAGTIIVNGAMSVGTGAVVGAAANYLTINGTMSFAAGSAFQKIANPAGWCCDVGITVNSGGLLNTAGTATQPVSITDSMSHGWYGITFQASSGGTMTGAHVSYGSPDITVNGSDPSALTISRSTIDHSVDGIVVNAGAPTLTDDAFLNNADAAVRYNYLPMNLNQDSGNTASGTSNGLNGITIPNSGVYAGTGTWSNPGIPIYASSVLITRTAQLTIGAGTTVAFALGGSGGATLDVSGTLVTSGTATQPVTLAGALAPPPQCCWNGISFEAGSVGRLTHTTVSEGSAPNCGGVNTGGEVAICGGSVSISHSTFSYSGLGQSGIWVGAGAPTLTDDTFTNDSGWAVWYNYVPHAATLARLSGLSASGNTGFATTGNAVVLPEGAYADSGTTPGLPNVGIPWQVRTGAVTVITGTTLTIAPGATVEFAYADSSNRNGIWVYGTLNAAGTGAAPITFTSGSQNVTPGSWDGIFYLPGSAGSLKYARVLYGGRGVACCGTNNFARYPDVMIYGTSAVSVTDSTMGSSGDIGLEIDGDTTLPAPTISSDVFTGNATWAVSLDKPPTRTANLSTLTASNNGGYNTGQSAAGNVVRIPGVAAGQTYSGTWTNPGLPFYTDVGFGTSATVAAGARLTLSPGVTFLTGILSIEGALMVDPGVTMKFCCGGASLQSHGSLTLAGTAQQPITLTSGRAAPAPGDWDGVQLYGGTASLRFVHISYPGWFGDRSIQVLGGSTAISNTTVISGGGDDVDVQNGALPVLRYDSFLAVPSGHYGVYTSSSAATVDATHNWWGDNSRPFNPTSNPNGKGTPVSNGVSFSPWLSLTIKPSSGTPGSSATVSGTGYAAGETVTLLWNCARLRAAVGRRCWARPGPARPGASKRP